MMYTSIISYNAWWMTVNILLALLPVYAGWLFAYTKSKYLRIVFGVLWLLFVPNTIYILTDLMHIPQQIVAVPATHVPVIILQYLVLEMFGIICFVLSFYPVERTFFNAIHTRNERFRNHVIIGMNFVIAFGVALGRFQRTNSWEVLTNIPRVIYDTVHVLTTPKLLLFILAFGVLGNFIYFLLRDMIKLSISHTHARIKRHRNLLRNSI